MKRLVIGRSVACSGLGIAPIKWSRPKLAQQTMGMPFGMIFAIILIVVFIVVAFMAVSHFLSIGSCSEVGLFYDGLQEKVDEAWKSQSSSFDFEIGLPSGIEKVCFGNLSMQATDLENYEEIKNYEVYEANTFLVPPGKACRMAWKMIEHIDISEITKERNPYCVDVSRGLKIKKDFYGKLVVVE